MNLRIRVPVVLQRLALGLFLLVASSGVLLYMDSAHHASNSPSGKKWQIHLVAYVKVLDVEEAEEGVLLGLRQSGLREGIDYEVAIHNAHGDMATLNSLIDSSISSGADLLITLSTPALQTAIRRARSVPVVFTYLADPIAAGAAKSDTDHLPNLTGVYSQGGYGMLFDVLRECLPRAKRVGTLYFPAEVNCVFHKDRCVEAAQKLGIEMITLPVSTPSEVPDAAASLCQRNLDAVVQVAGNLPASSFPSIARAAEQARLPVFAFMSSQARAGAAVVVARDYHDAAVEAALVAARVMRGEDPSTIPLQNFTRTKLIVNLRAARAANLTIPGPLLSRAEEVLGP